MGFTRYIWNLRNCVFEHYDSVCMQAQANARHLLPRPVIALDRLALALLSRSSSRPRSGSFYKLSCTVQYLYRGSRLVCW